MKIYKENDTLTAICNNCQAKVKAVFKRQNVPLSDGSGMVRDVLVGVCENCNHVCLTPAQSLPQIRSAVKESRQSVEGNISAYLQDILYAACQTIGAGKKFVSPLMKYYAYNYVHGRRDMCELEKSLSDPLIKNDEDTKRISIKGKRIRDYYISIQKGSTLKTQNDVLKSMIIMVKNDILDKKNKQAIEDLKSIYESHL